MKPLEITEQNFDTEVLLSDKPVLLDFWAPSCGPCRMLSPVVDAFAETRDDIKFGKINVDECEDLAARFDVMSIPLLVIIENGEIKKTSAGYITEEQLAALFG